MADPCGDWHHARVPPPPPADSRPERPATPPTEHLLRTLVDLVAEGGLEAVSVRRLAERAGVSIGAVQHHFPTKDALLLAAMEHVSAAFGADLLARLHPGAAPAEGLRTLALRLVGLEEGDRATTAVWLAFVARAVVDEPTAQVHRREWRQVEEMIAAGLSAAAPHRPAPADDAAGLLALLDGLAIAVAVEPERMPPARAARIVEVHLAALLEPQEERAPADPDRPAP